VAAETGPGEWRRLAVFDDGWVELPGMARSLSDTRSRLRTSLLALVGFVAALGVIAGISALLATVDDLPMIVAAVPLVLTLALVGAAVVLSVRWRRRGVEQVRGDAEQAQRERRARLRITRAPGAPLFRRAGSATQLAAWLEGETHVAGDDVAAVDTAREGRVHVVTVVFVDGRTRAYRSPDAKLVELLGPARRPPRAARPAPTT